MSEIIKGSLGFKGQKGETGEIGTPVPYNGTFNQLKNDDVNKYYNYIILDSLDTEYEGHWVYYDRYSSEWKDGGIYLSHMLTSEMRNRLNEVENESNETKVRQDLLEQKYDDQIAELANENPQLPEIVDARNGYDTLGKRLNDIESVKDFLAFGVIEGLNAENNEGIITISEGKAYNKDKTEIQTQSIDFDITNKPSNYIGIISVNANGKVELADGTTEPATKGKGIYTFTENAVNNDTVIICGQTLTAGINFLVGSSIENTVEHIKNVLNEISNFAIKYIATRDANKLIVEEKEAGNGNNADTSFWGNNTFIVTGNIEGTYQSITCSNETEYIEPEIPETSLKLYFIKRKDSEILIKDVRNFVYPVDDVRTQRKIIYKQKKKFQNYIGICNHLPREANVNLREQGLKYVKNLGLKSIRIDIDWSWCETEEGVYNFSKYITFLNYVKNFNMKALLIIATTNVLYNNVSPDKFNTDSSITAYKNFAIALVNRLKEENLLDIIIGFELGNEQDMYGKVENYAKVLKETYKPLHQIDNSIKIICGAFSAVSSRATSWIEELGKRGFLEKFVDIISVHLYLSNPMEVQDILYSYNKAIERYCIKKIPIYLTEFGYHTVNYTEETRSRYLIIKALLALAYGCEYMDIYTSYTPEQDISSSEHWYGIIRKNGESTLTSSKVKELLEKMNDLVYCGVVNKDNFSVILQFMDMNGKFFYIGWTTDENKNIMCFNGKSYELNKEPSIIETSYNGTMINEKNTVTKKWIDIDYYRHNLFLGENNYGNGTYNANIGNQNESLGQYSKNIGERNKTGTSSLSIGVGSFALTGAVDEILGFDAQSKTITVREGWWADQFNVNDEIFIVSTYGTYIEKVKIIGKNGNLFTLNETPTLEWNYIIRPDENYGAHAHGIGTVASGIGAFASGRNCAAAASFSQAFGDGTISGATPMHVIGKYNDVTKGGLFVVGNGTSKTSRSNAFRVASTGVVYSQGAYNTTGADYAEYFEWEDGNLNNEDRIGMFVTLKGNKIRIATADDDFILGVISGKSSIIGNSHSDNWQGRYLTDEWGRYLTDMDEDGHPRLKENPEYDNTRIYIPREERKEWAVVSLLGVIPVKDDGSCVPNKYCKVNENGIATNSDEKAEYRVLRRINDTIVEILMK